ncbi:HAMP domain-containing methyl-accepting chemotaxis protein [Methylobacterium sp. 37f]|uniref:methyl-accepting chemotaxis protein n=1 Tax=Methylobacterium sp. 37f TaxID=2817058 RepID=UPI001FFCE62F|nr:HAMP domain-containing methyl-accepting chemotaxis protein [Methylobacterium sp. 37f]MCK2056190.1 methyl-accepting chemotaxis protein [Methylobacterium sp. 37f]
MTIKTKILLFVLSCGAITLLVAGIGISTLSAFNGAMEESRMAARRALDAANVNRLVTNVVLESRGVYAAKDTADARKYADRLRQNLTAMNRLLTEWGGRIPAEERAQFERVVQGAATFTTLRQEIARLGTEVAPAAAAEQGFNEANRANRQAFQDSIDVLVASGQVQVTAIDAATDALYANRLTLLFALAIGGTLASLVLGGLIGHHQIAAPLASVTAAIRRLSGGDLDLPSVKPSRDEIGAIWSSMQVFAHSMREAEALRQTRDEAAGLASTRRRAERSELADRFQGSVGALVGNLSNAAAEMEETARAMSANAERTNRQSAAVMQAAEDTAQNVQAVAAATEELAATANEIGHQVSQTSAAAANAVESTRLTNTRVEALAQGAARIGDVVALISSIAGQTNLLALNATIEAARAGESGRGFAVVASEVKTLAAQTAKATDEITAQITMIQAATRETVEAIREIGTTIGSVHSIAVGVAAAVEEQQVATQEIARSVSDAARGTQDVTQTMAEVQGAAVEVGAGAAQVLASAAELARRSNTLDAEVTHFVGSIRAA